VPLILWIIVARVALAHCSSNCLAFRCISPVPSQGQSLGSVIFPTSRHAGKTAIAERIAQRINSGNVPDSLRDCRLIGLDMGALIGGASYRGEFKERLKKVVDRVKDSEGEIILFIDEVSLEEDWDCNGD
jgi:hypothetical protein